jgi:hypothetical protein
MPQYAVTVCRRFEMWTEIEIRAKDEESARTRVLERVGKAEMQWQMKDIHEWEQSACEDVVEQVENVRFPRT